MFDAQHIPNNSTSFKYKSSPTTNRNGVKIAAPLKYLSNFWRLIEMSLIICGSWAFIDMGSKLYTV